MLSLNKPTEKFIEQFIDGQKSLTLSYKQIGVSREGICPTGYGRDHVREKLGTGREAFTTAISLFKKWEQFAVGWVEVFPPKTPLVPDAVIAVLAWHKYFWSLNACRIIYVIDEESPINRFGFGYGTLPGHAEIGEERFLLEWDERSNIVSYDILAFSNPSNLLGWLAYPLVRLIQNRFRRDSARVMKQNFKGIGYG